MKKLVIIWHSLTGGSKALAQAAYMGAIDETGVTTHVVHADDATVGDMLDGDGYIFVFPENLAAISGVMKAFFDRLYYPCLGQIEGRAFAIIVCAGSDGRNAVAQAERIATGWRLKKVCDSRIICTYAQSEEEIMAPKVIADNERNDVRDIGALMAGGLAMGIF